MAGRDEMREYVGTQYGGRWRLKVDGMTDRQVYAIYRQMIRKRKKIRLDATEVRGGEQLCLFNEKGEIKEGYLQ